MAGCVAIDPASTSDPRAQDIGSSNTAALNYSISAFGASPTWSNGEEITFINCSMIDGAGYEWNTGARAGTSTGMPDWSKTDGSKMAGNTGVGHARITLITLWIYERDAKSRVESEREGREKKLHTKPHSHLIFLTKQPQ
ncbi:MAG: hypothetical protein LBL94_08215 [Prevotellaceae bacterium]|jgi:hypothetical protein|nr:hypothetical protein [Prevotellaceae bacterium]